MSPRRPTEERLEAWAAEVQSLLSKCSNSQPYEDGEPVWLNSHTYLAEVLTDVGVPQSYWEEVAARVKCPCCDTTPGVYDEVGVKSSSELRFEEMREEWFDNFEHQFEQFYEHLEKTPYMGLAHPFGRKINRSISKLPSIPISEENWWRARRLVSGKTLTAADFAPPDPQKIIIPEGRFNHHGQPVLYLAQDRQVAAMEVLHQGESRAWVVEFTLRGLDPILDLTVEDGWAGENTSVLLIGLGHIGHVSRPAIGEGWKPEYFVPRFIADCAKLQGYKGIIYQSARTVIGKNLVLFEWQPDNMVVKGEPSIVETWTWEPPERTPPFSMPFGFE